MSNKKQTLWQIKAPHKFFENYAQVAIPGIRRLKITRANKQKIIPPMHRGDFRRNTWQSIAISLKLINGSEKNINAVKGFAGVSILKDLVNKRSKFISKIYRRKLPLLLPKVFFYAIVPGNDVA
jgi:hypothetical protein